ncbi:UNVERIFIED_CONTAM: hypothetical protein PYX00_002847 [Menopon gallinae]|uniref:Uncharacterized protein n=1 Tax=Menopon gallinae TaxID=328185 RepID=A0AAW2HZ74_9NEOP
MLERTMRSVTDFEGLLGGSRQSRLEGRPSGQPESFLGVRERPSLCRQNYEAICSAIFTGL